MHTEQHTTAFDHPRGPGWYAISPVDDIMAFAIIEKHQFRQHSARPATLVRVLVVDNANNEVLHSIVVGEKRLEEAGFRLQFSPDGALLAIGGTWAVRVFSVGPIPGEWHFQGPAGLCDALAFSEDGTELISMNEDGTALVWDLTR